MQPLQSLLVPRITDWIKTSLGSRIVINSAEELAGSTSSDLFRITTDNAKFVLRLFTNQEWLLHEPDLAVHEAEALKLAQMTGLNVPEVVAWDENGSCCGIPAVLMTALNGNVNLTPSNQEDWLLQQAQALILMHAQDAVDFKWTYFPYNKPAYCQVPEWTSTPRHWQQALEITNQPAPNSKLSFIHRDYHPMNTLWQNGQLSGIVDWVNACRGPSSFDLAWCRINLMQVFGVQTANKFLELYLSLEGTDNTYHPYWDLMAILELLPGPPDVYAPWKMFGHAYLNKEMLKQRTEEYLANVLEYF